MIGDDDKHLNVTLSIYKNEDTQVLTVTTIVHIKNWLGRLYMLPVIPAHRKIVPATFTDFRLDYYFYLRCDQPKLFI